MQKSKIKIKDFMDYKYLSGVKSAPNGRNIAFVVKEANKDQNNYDSNLWIYRISENVKEKLPCHINSSFVWFDNKSIIFVGNSSNSSKDDTDKIYKFNINNGRKELLAEVPFQIRSLQYNGSDTLLMTALLDRNKNETRQEGVHIIEEIPFWKNGEGFTYNRRVHLYALNLKTKKLKKLINENYNVNNFAVMGEKICINMSCFVDKADVYSDLYLYDLNNSSCCKLTDGTMNIGFVYFKDNNTVIYSATDMEEAGIETNKDIYELDLSTGNIHRKTIELDKCLEPCVCTDVCLGSGNINLVKDNNLYFLSNENYHVYLNVMKDDVIDTLIKTPGVINMFDVSNNLIAFIGFRANKLPELYIYKDSKEEQITDFNVKTVENKRFSPLEYFKVKTSDNCELDSWIMRPVNFDKNNKYPVILQIHGGPKAVYSDIFYHELQVLAAWGYVIVFTNPRGSDGRGNDFANSIRGKWGTRDYKDLIEVLDYAINNYDFIDAENQGVTGGSYGGFMTNWIIGQTDRFKAAVSQRSISNWITKFCTTDIGYYFVDDEFAGSTPWDGYQDLWDTSPLKYADSVNTPTLFIHSEKDYRCWLPEGMQMFTALKYFNVDTRLVIFENEDHNMSRQGKPLNRIKRMQEMINWFNKYLK